MQKALEFVASLHGKLEFDDNCRESMMRRLSHGMWCDECVQLFLQLLMQAIGGRLIGESRTEQPSTPSALLKADPDCVAQFLIASPLITERLRQIHLEYVVQKQKESASYEDTQRRKIPCVSAKTIPMQS